MLATRDAHEPYGGHGFDRPEIFMERERDLRRLRRASYVPCLRRRRLSQLASANQPPSTERVCPLTRTPRPPHSAARVRVSPIRPCLLALYAARSETPSNPATEATFTTLPEPLSSIILPNSLHMRKGPVRFTASVLFHSASVISSAGTMVLMPALFTNTSMRPNSPITAPAISRTSASSETSPGTERVLAPAERSSSNVSLGAARSFATIRNPSSASTRATRRPIPRAAPVTTATSSLSFIRHSSYLAAQRYVIASRLFRWPLSTRERRCTTRPAIRLPVSSAPRRREPPRYSPPRGPPSCRESRRKRCRCAGRGRRSRAPEAWGVPRAPSRTRRGLRQRYVPR